MKKTRKFVSGIVLVLVVTMLVSVTAFAKGGDQNWPFAGHDLENTRAAKTETKLSAENVSGLSPQWALTTGGDISATPAVEGKFLYFPDWAGNLFKVDADTGEVIWSAQISSYTGVPDDFARTTPAIVDDLLIFGDQGGRLFAGASVIAVDKNTGALVWVTRPDDHPTAIITQSAVVFDGIAYVGVASFEEFYAAVIPGYECCSFRGSLLALDVETGAIVWKSYTAPEGYSGNAVWGSTPVVDRVRKSVYISTGNNYSVPDAVEQCVVANQNDPDAQRACLAADNFFDAVVSFDLKSGAPRWATTVIPFDAWTVSCLPPFDELNPANCPELAGPDFDFGQGPILYTVKPKNGPKYDLLGVGQKSGQYWALNPDSGQIVWVTKVGPGGVAGGLQWGSAYDGERLYVASTNSEFKDWTLMDGSTIAYGFWSALDPATGAILWQAANPAMEQANGAVSVANGVVYACSMDDNGMMYAMDAANGQFLWSFASGGSCAAGASIANGTVYWGSGYASFGGTANDKLYAFGLP